MTQLCITIIILILAVAYASWRIFRAVKRRNDPCAGCTGCTLSKEQRKTKRDKGECQ